MTEAQARLLLGTEHPCSYLPDRLSRSLFVDPGLALEGPQYSQLLNLGFRRSGPYVYRPACRHCQQCLAARIPVAEFRPSRAQRRCHARNVDLALCLEAGLDSEHFNLYRRYLQARHPGGGMDPDDHGTFQSFLAPPWGRTLVLALRGAAGKLLAGAITDRLPDGLSAVYTYFDPAAERRSLGTYAILRQVLLARELCLPYLYLGYWVPGSPSMDYKRSFQPLEVLGGKQWTR